MEKDKLYTEIVFSRRHSKTESRPHDYDHSSMPLLRHDFFIYYTYICLHNLVANMAEKVDASSYSGCSKEIKVIYSTVHILCFLR